MYSNISLNTNQNNPFFGNPQQVFKEIKKLSRLVQVSGALHKGEKARQDDILRITALCEKAFGITRENISEAFQLMNRELKKIGPSFGRIYFPRSFPQPSDQESMEKLLHKIIKDVKSVEIDPVKKPLRGQSGTILLVSYPRFNKSKEPSIRNCVIKSTTRNEIATTWIYKKIIEFLFEKENQSEGFFIPEAISLNFERKIHESLDMTKSKLNDSESRELKKMLKDIKDAYPVENEDDDEFITADDNHIIILEKLRENIFDFARAKYPKIEEMAQRRKFFEKLGKLSVIDLFVGNLDRLVRIFINRKGKYALQPIEANLGNIMFGGLQKDDMFAIDNEIDPDLLQKESKEKYHAFLEELLQTPSFEKTLASNMVESILSGITVMAEDETSVRYDKLLEELEPFSEDLKKFGGDCFEKGIRDMIFQFQKELLPKWASDKAKPFKEYLSENYPEIYSGIEERLEIFARIFA